MSLPVLHSPLSLSASLSLHTRPSHPHHYLPSTVSLSLPTIYSPPSMSLFDLHCCPLVTICPPLSPCHCSLLLSALYGPLATACPPALYCPPVTVCPPLHPLSGPAPQYPPIPSCSLQSPCHYLPYTVHMSEPPLQCPSVTTFSPLSLCHCQPSTIPMS